MSIIDNAEPSRFVAVMNETLIAEVKRRLKEPLMKIAEVEVDAAVDEAVAELNVRSKAFRDVEWMRDTIEFIVTRSALTT